MQEAEVYLHHLHASLPDSRLSLDDIFRRLNLPSRQQKVFSRAFGLAHAAYSDPSQSLESLLAPIAKSLVEEGYQRPDYLFYAHCMLAQDEGREAFLRRLSSWCPDEPPVLGVSHQNCASFIRAAILASQYLRSQDNGDAYVWCIGADRITNLDESTRYLQGSSILGDGALGFVASRRAPAGTAALKIVGTHLTRDERYHAGVYMEREQLKSFYASHDELLSSCIKNLLAENQLTLNDISMIMPHNINCPVWKRFAYLHNFPFERIMLEHVSELGHTYTIDPFLNMRTTMTSKRCQDGDLFLLVNVGMGAFVGAMILRYQEA